MLFNKDAKALNFAGTFVRMPEEMRNCWPELLAEKGFELSTRARVMPDRSTGQDRNKYGQKDLPTGFQPKEASVTRQGAQVILESCWNREFGYLLYISLPRPEWSLEFGKVVQNQLLASGCTLHTKDLSYLD